MIDSQGRMNVDVGGATLNVDLGSVTLEDGTTHTSKLAIDPSGSAHTTQTAQTSLTQTLATAVTGTTPPAAVPVDGYNGASVATVSAVGTVAAQAATFKFQGNMDNGSTWYDVAIVKRYDSAAGISTARAVAGSDTLTPGNGTVVAAYDLLDFWRYIRINPTANSLATGLSAALTSVPV